MPSSNLRWIHKVVRPGAPGGMRHGHDASVDIDGNIPADIARECDTTARGVLHSFFECCHASVNYSQPFWYFHELPSITIPSILGPSGPTAVGSPKESPLNEPQIELLDDAWRKGLNRAVREFESAVVGLDESAFSAVVRTVLREIGEALEIDCSALVEFSDDAQAVISSHYWQSTPMSVDPFEAFALESLVEHLKLGRDPVVLQDIPEEGPDEGQPDETPWHPHSRVRSAVIIPLRLNARSPCAWVFGTFRGDHLWPEPVIEHLQLLGDIVVGALERHHRELGDSRAHSATMTARSRTAAPAANTSVPSRRGFDEIIGESPALLAALSRLEEVANTESTVLLLGETGTGKELFARALHARGPRRGFPLVSVNCGALPPSLIESELFGHQRGAFTGAVALRQGRFEVAHHGTLFLDEIGDLPLDLQVKLLRVLQEGAFERVGSSHGQIVDVRIVAATHRNLVDAIAENEFRADLYYRLNVFPIRLPPLRERREDIPALVWTIIRKRQRAIHRQINTVPADVMDQLQRHWWPGNIRELENVLERALIHTTGDTLTLLDWTPEVGEVQASAGTTLMSVERAHIQEVLRECGWKINGLGNAADRLGLHPNTLRFRMKKLGIGRRDSIPVARRPTESEARNRAS